MSNLLFRRTWLRVTAVGFLSVGLWGCQSGPAPQTTKPVRSAKLTSAQIAELKRLGFAEEADGWTFNISDSKLLFDFAHDTLSPQGIAVVMDIARSLMKVGLTRIRAEGHTDNVGNTEFNLALSVRRAEHVAHQLVVGGFSDANVVRVGFGHSKPVGDNTTTEGRAQNRRVSLIVLVD